LYDLQFNLFDKSKKQKNALPWETKSEKQFLSTLQAVTYLMGSNFELLMKLHSEPELVQSINFIVEHLGSDLSQSHVNLLPSLLWSLQSLSILDLSPETPTGVIHHKLVKKSL